MPSKRAIEILEDRSTLCVSEIARLSNADAWGRIYGLGVGARGSGDDRARIGFTGFTPPQKAALAAAADHSGFFRVASGLPESAEFLISGSKPDQRKLAAARRHNVTILSGAQFVAFMVMGLDPATDCEARSDLGISMDDDALIDAAAAVRAGHAEIRSDCCAGPAGF